MRNRSDIRADQISREGPLQRRKAHLFLCPFSGWGPMHKTGQGQINKRKTHTSSLGWCWFAEEFMVSHIRMGTTSDDHPKGE